MGYDSIYGTGVLADLSKAWLVLAGNHFSNFFEDLTLSSGKVISVCSHINFYDGAGNLFRQFVYTYDIKGNCIAGMSYDYAFIP